MLKIKNINITYEREIIKNSDFIAPDNGLVVIKGSSGSGKTSLIRNIVLEELSFDKYVINGIGLDDNNIDQIKKNMISLMDQQNSFIEELTISEHFKLIQEIYKNKDKYHLIDKLDLKQALNKFPNQLSGGEKTRVALVLCLLKGTKIIVMDEPTSSIDSYYTQIVVSVLKKLADDHLIIVASHDDELFDNASYIYEIKDKAINLVSGTINDKEGVANNIINKITKVNFSKYMLMMKKYHLASNILMTILISLSITIASIGIYYGFNKLNDSYVSFNELYGNEINIYKPLYIDDKSYYSASGHENYFSDEEYDEILSIEGIAEISPHIELPYKSISYTIDDSRKMDINVSDVFSLYNQEELVQELIIKKAEANDPDVIAVSYDEKKDYSKFVEKKYNDSGVYISKELAKLLGVDKIKKESVLKFSLPVPVYKESGDMEISQGDSNEWLPAYPSLCIMVDVELPVAGVLEGMDMGLWSKSYPNALFIPLSYYEKIISENRAESVDTYYYVEEIFGFKRTVESNETIVETVTAVPWKPDTLTIRLDSIEKYQDVAAKLEELGYCIMSNVAFIDTINDYAYNISNTFIIFSIVMLLVLMMINFVLKFINRNCDYSLIRYFRNLGYSFKETKRILSNRYLVNCIIMITISFGYLLGYFIYTRITGNFIVPIKYEYVLVIIILSFIIEYIFPRLFFRGDKK